MCKRKKIERKEMGRKKRENILERQNSIKVSQGRS